MQGSIGHVIAQGGHPKNNFFLVAAGFSELLYVSREKSRQASQAAGRIPQWSAAFSRLENHSPSTTWT
jgi:hypothetical protein